MPEPNSDHRGVEAPRPQTSRSPTGGAREEEKDGLVHVTEGYFKYTDVLFDWPKCMSVWQRNAVKSLLNGEVLVLDDHPLHIAGQQGIELYRSTASNGQQKLLFSLKQLEYLQYYIHEHKLADPKVVRNLMGGENAGWPEDFDFDAVVDEGRIPLPLNVLPKDIGEIKPINFTSLAGMKKELGRIGKHNKSVKREAMLMRPSSSADYVKTEAELDNEREGPGLRRGPMRRRPYDWTAEAEEEHQAGSPDVWANHPASQAPVADAADRDDLSSMPELNDTSVPASPGLSGSLTDSLNLSTPPSILERQDPDTPDEHYYHAQQAILLASQGGLVAALHKQSESPPEGDPTEDEKKIGRSLFIALDVVTFEKDESVVLEIGWSALWWQPVKPEDLRGEFEEMRDQGHYIVQDHIHSCRNGETKPDHRDMYQHGNSLRIKADDVHVTVSQLLSDLSKKAGGGPTYLVLHLPGSQVDTEATGANAKQLDLLKIGLFPMECHQTLRPTTTQYPVYSELRGNGSTSVINTALLLKKVEPTDIGENAKHPASTRPLVDVAANLFTDGDERSPKYVGNAGNYASCVIEIMLHVLLEHDFNAVQPSAERQSVPESQDASKITDNAVEEPPAVQSSQGKGPISPSTTNFVEVKEPDSDASHESDYDSDAGGIQGVYFQDDDGGMIEYDDDDDKTS